MIQYIDAVCAFIKDLFESTRNTAAVVPFMIDCCIAVGKPEVVDPQHDDNNNDGGDDDDDDDNGQEQKEEKSDYEDYVGDFEQRIRANKLSFVKDKYDPTNPEFTVRALFDVFKEKMPEAKNKKMSYPHKKRFILFIDRRKENNNKNIYLYDPPQGTYTRDIPDGYIAV